MNKIKSLLFSLTCMVAVIGAFAFKAPLHKTAEVTYHYISDSDVLADMQNPLNWVVEESNCTSSGNIPCGIEYSDVRQDFDDYLQAFTTAGAITSAATQRKYIP